MTNKFKSASAMGIRAALVGLASVRTNVNEVLNAAGVKRETVDDPEGKLSLEQISSFWRVASERLSDPLVGINMAKLTPFGTYQTSDYLLSSSSTLREGLRKFVRFFSLIHQELGVNGIESQLQYEFQVWQKSEEDISRHSLEFEVALIFERLRSVTQKNISLKQVKFMHQEPTNTAHIYSEYFGCPVSFAQSTNSIIFDKHYLELPCVDSDSNLADLLENNAKRILEKLPKFEEHAQPMFLLKFNEKLKDELKEGRASIENMATCFGMSPRTLQRKLKHYDLSYSEILTNLRIELSKDMLSNPSLSLAEIAFLLGFSESSAFHRAFKQWTNKTPLEFRKNQEA
ncbi:MAG: hypothetical protein CME71_09200 [Halobacteriovorax sp.]|nr:hypothetical protein [Halobacteriovorax sp.]